MSHGRPYPRDDFDVEAVVDGPHGVHRAPRSAWSRWAPLLVVVLVLPALAFALITWLSSWEGRPDVNLPVFGDEPTQGETPGPSQPETPEPTTEPEPTPTPTPTPTIPPPDLSRTVEVYNATQISGLAGGAAGVLEDAGFVDVSTGNWSAEDPATSVVYLPAEADLGTGQAVAQALGITAVEVAPDLAGEVVVVVLTEDYQPEP